MGARKWLAFIGLGAIGLVVACGPATPSSTSNGSLQNLTIALSYQATPSASDPWHHMATTWQSLLQKQSNGKIQIQLFPGGVLSGGNQTKEVELVQDGTIQAAIEPTGTLAVVDPRFQVVELPWIVPTQQVADKIMDGPLGQETLGWVKAKGMEPIAIGSNGFRQLANRKHPVSTPQDLQGLKIRVPGTKSLVDTWSALGAEPTVVNFAELYTALQQGTVDGEELPYNYKLSTKFYEVEKYATTINYSFDLIYIVFSQQFWNSIPPADQQLLKSTAQAAAKDERAFITDSQQQTITQLQSDGMQVQTLTPQQLKAFQDKMPPIYQKYGSIIGQSVVSAFQKASSQ